MQELKDVDRPKRLTFCNFVRDKCEFNAQWFKKIIFSDEATLHLNGTINTHNCFYYSNTNEHRTIEIPIKLPAITVWAIVTSDGRIRYKIQSGTMNSVQYCDILKDIVIPIIKV